MKTWIHPEDPYQMNWIEGKNEWGMVKCPKGISVRIEQEVEYNIEGYSVERDLEKMSNDRGDFLLHPEPFHLKPKETYIIEWVLFWHEGKQDFYQKLRNFSNYIEVKADSYTVFTEEMIQIQITPMNGMPVVVTDLITKEEKQIEKDQNNTY